MSPTKQDVVEGLEREIGRLSAELRKFMADKYTVQEHQEDGSTDMTAKFRETVAECARELNRLKVALDSLHVS